MEKSFGLLFYLKKFKGYKEGETDIYVRITVNGKSADVSIKRKCDPLKWNTASGRADGKTEFAKSLNAYLEVIQQKVYEMRKQLIENDETVTAKNIKILLQGREIQKHKYMLMEIFKQHNDQMAALVVRIMARDFRKI